MITREVALFLALEHLMRYSRSCGYPPELEEAVKQLREMHHEHIVAQTYFGAASWNQYEAKR